MMKWLLVTQLTLLTLQPGESFQATCAGEWQAHTTSPLGAECHASPPPPPPSAVALTGRYDGGGPEVKIHPNPHSILYTWEGFPQIDDRVGQCFIPSVSGWLDHIDVDVTADGYAPAGDLLIRVYPIQGVCGSTGMPLGAAPRMYTPTTGWLAESQPVALTAALLTPRRWLSAVFAGTQKVWLQAGSPVVFITDWRPRPATYANTFAILADYGGAGHPGNMANDGFSVNNGPVPYSGLQLDVHFRAYVEVP